MSHPEGEGRPPDDQRFWPWLLIATVVLLLLVVPLIVSL
jgi:hypothetical protein